MPVSFKHCRYREKRWCDSLHDTLMSRFSFKRTSKQAELQLHCWLLIWLLIIDHGCSCGWIYDARRQRLKPPHCECVTCDLITAFNWRNSWAEITFDFICIVFYLREKTTATCFFLQTWTTFIWAQWKTNWRPGRGSTRKRYDRVLLLLSSVTVWVCMILLTMYCDVTQSAVNDALCDVTQGVVVSDEELRRTFLQREEAEPQQGEEPVDGFRHPDLLGKTAPHTPCKPHFNSFHC